MQQAMQPRLGAAKHVQRRVPGWEGPQGQGSVGLAAPARFRAASTVQLQKGPFSPCPVSPGCGSVRLAPAARAGVKAVPAGLGGSVWRSGCWDRCEGACSRAGVGGHMVWDGWGMASGEEDGGRGQGRR